MEMTDEELDSVVPCVARIGLLGYWRRGAGREGARSYLRGWASCCLICCIALSAAEKLITDTPSDLAELTMTAFELTVPFTVVSKGVCFILQRDTIHKLIELLVDIRRRYAEREDGPNRRRACYLYVLGVQRVLLVMALLIIGAWVTAPMLPHVFSLGSQNESVPWQTPLPLWLPVDMQRSPLYEALYLAQTCCVLASLTSASALDAFFCNITLMIAAELQVLNDNISSPGGSQPVVDKAQTKSSALEVYSEGEPVVPQRKNGATEDTGVSRTGSGPPRNQTSLRLVQNIRHHQAILRCIGLLETSMKYAIPFQLLNSVTSMCFVLFVCSASLQRGSGLNSALKTILCMPYLIFETGIYCIYGQEILDQSEDLLQSAVNYEYIEAGAGCWKTLLIFMLMVSSPIEIKVSKIVPLSKPTFLQKMLHLVLVFKLVKYNEKQCLEDIIMIHKVKCKKEHNHSTILHGSYTLINLLYHFSVPDE